MDRFSEEIAHFIGVLALSTEEARQRLDYDSFNARRAAADESEELSAVDVEIDNRFILTPFNPNVEYAPPGFRIIPTEADPFLDLSKIVVRPPDIWFDYWHPSTFFEADWSSPRLLHKFISTEIRLSYEGITPASAAGVVWQSNVLLDADYVNLSSSMVGALGFQWTDGLIGQLEQKAAALDPFPSLDDFSEPAFESAIAVMIEEIATAFPSADENGPPNAQVSLHEGASASGTHVNGQLAPLAPKLEDLRLDRGEADDVAGPTASAKFAPGEGAFEPERSLDISAGGNTLVNEAVLADAWIDAPIYLVRGNYTSIDLTIQVNAWSDRDVVDASFDPASAQTKAFNVATLETEADPAGAARTGPADQFPAHWSITHLSGNLVFLNWIEQVNRLIDDDVVVAQTSGAASMLVTGENTAVNIAQILGLGFQYDLIVAGGNFYSANIIDQRNIVLDDDFLRIAGGEGASAPSASTSGNLLWNEASIVHLGATTFEPLADAFKDFADALWNGGDEVPGAILNNPAFAGLGLLNVLYIEGDILDLQYIKQTNILSDADQLFFADGLLPSGLSSTTSIATGGNEAINLARIVDVGSDSEIHVGGDIYSDALLYQAELIEPEPVVASGAQDGLASEAVVFLADEMLEPAADDPLVVDRIDPVEPQSDDVMQAMLG